MEAAISGKLTDADKQYVYSVFGGSTLPINDFMGFIADTVAGSVQYGSREKMCNLFNSVSTATIQQILPVFNQFAVQSGMDINDSSRTVL